MFVYSKHWLMKKKYRKTISNADIEYAINHSPIYRDRKWVGVYNALCRVPPLRRVLKVVYKMEGKAYKILTAYWLT